VREVLHATFEQHAYPAHTHADWTVLLIDDGAVVYELDRSPHRAAPSTISLLPPDVPHDGRSAVSGRPFRKRVLYLEPTWLPARAVDAAAARPTVLDPRAIAAVTAVHAALQTPADAMTAEWGILSLRAVIREHLGDPPSSARDAPLARRLRELLDERVSESFTLAEAGRVLGAHPSHLVRVFSDSYGIAPHRYVIGRRIDHARHLLLQGHSPAHAAVAAGFHDQSHLTRHFRRVLGTTPGAFAA
jgi:AraC-like DNA-binding protein